MAPCKLLSIAQQIEDGKLHLGSSAELLNLLHDVVEIHRLVVDDGFDAGREEAGKVVGVDLVRTGVELGDGGSQ